MKDSVTTQPVRSVPAPGLTRGQQPRKLRDSCIHCANSKVRCNKEKPVCSRCVRRHLTCEYKVSRRTGRTSRMVSQVTGASSGTTVSSLHPKKAKAGSDATVIKPSSSSAPVHSHLLTPTNTAFTDPSSPEHALPPTPDLWYSYSILSPSALGPEVRDIPLPSVIPIGADVDDLFASVIPSPQLHSPEIDRLPTQNVGDGISLLDQPLLQPQPQPLEILNTPMKPLGCCLAIILNILAGLFPNAATACQHRGSLETPTRIRTIESVISDNRQIIDTINTVLDCPCSQDEYLITMISLAVLKVMGWYIAAARDTSSSSSSSPTFNDTLAWTAEGDFTYHADQTSPSSAFGEHVLYLPTPIDDYCVNGTDQARMVAQLVLGELHRVQHLVNVLSSHLESIRLRTGVLSSTSAASGLSSATDAGDVSFIGGVKASLLSGPTFSCLEDDLRQRLHAVSSEVIEILRRS